MPYTVKAGVDGCSGYAVVKDGENSPIPGGCHGSKAQAIAHMVAIQANYEADRAEMIPSPEEPEMEAPEAEQEEPNDALDLMEEMQEYGINARQAEMYEAYEDIAERYGKWLKDAGPDGAHYVSRSPFSEEGLLCSNCVFFQGGRMCEVVAGDIAPEGVCKLWIIAQKNLSAEPIEEGMEYESRKQPRTPDGKFASTGGSGKDTTPTAAKQGNTGQLYIGEHEYAKEHETETAERLFKEQKPYLRSIDEESREAIEDYTNEGYKFINKTLRGAPPPPPPPATQERAREKAEKISDAIESAPPLAQPMTVYRGVGHKAFGLKAGQDIGSLVNMEFKDEGITSVSLSNFTGGMFGGQIGSITMHISVPKGSKALFVEPMSLSRGEYEVLLPRNTTFRVVEKLGANALSVEVVN